MSKVALAFIGVAAVVGIGFAIKSADAANEDEGDDGIIPEPDEPPTPLPSNPGPSTPDPGTGEVPGQPAPSDNPGAGSGAPAPGAFDPGLTPTLNPLDPAFSWNVLLSKDTVLPAPFDKMSLWPGVKSLQYHGLTEFGPEAIQFNEWLQPQSIAAANMPLYIWVSLENPNDWISGFYRVDPAGSTPPGHFIEYQISPTSSNQGWMRAHIIQRS